MKILLTGAGGQVGLDLISRLLDGGDEVHASDVAPRPAAAPPGRPGPPPAVTAPAAGDRRNGDHRPHGS